MYVPFELIKIFIFASVFIYFIYDYFDRRRIKDEREEFLKLKTFELVQKVTLLAILFLSIGYFLYPEMPAFVPIILIVMCTLYTEILGKIYLRSRY